MMQQRLWREKIHYTKRLIEKLVSGCRHVALSVLEIVCPTWCNGWLILAGHDVVDEMYSMYDLETINNIVIIIIIFKIILL